MDFKRIFSVLNTLALRGLGSGVAVVFTVLISRYLPTESAASFFLLFNISVIAAVCFRWGVDEVIIRRVAKLSRSEINTTARELMKLSHRRVVLWVAVVLMFSVTAYQSVPRRALASVDLINLIFAFGSAAFLALTACAARVLQGSGYTNFATFLLNIAIPSLSLVGFFVLINIGVPSARDLVVMYTCVAMLVYTAVVVRCYGNPVALLFSAFKLRWDSPDSRAANKLGVVVLAQQAVGWAALLTIPYAYGDDAYKGFVVIQKVATLISLIMLAVNFTFSRRFASMYAAGKLEELRRIVSYSLLAIIIGSICITLFLMVTRHWLFSYAQVGVDMTGLLFILLLSQVFFSVSALFSVVLSMASDDNYLFVMQAAINGVGALLLIVLCQLFSMEAASSMLVASYCVLSIVLGLRVKRITTTVKVA